MTPDLPVLSRRMSSTRQLTPERLRDDRTLAYLVGAVAVLGGWLLDVAVLGRWALETLAIRASWAATLAICGVLVRAGCNGDLVGSLSSLSTSAAMVGLAWCTGGTASLIFPVLAFMPVLISQVEPDRRAPVRVTIVSTLAGTWGVIAAEGGSLAMAGGWAAWTLFLGWWALLWSSRLRKQRDAEIAAERREAELLRERAVAIEERARALEGLAAAQHRQTAAERLAAVGRLATGVAHEINNPLAFVKANLEYAAAIARTGDVQQIATLNEESLQGVERIEQIVRDLRGLGSGAADDEAIEPTEIASVVQEARRLASVRLRRVATVDIQVQPGLAPYACARGRMVQVLINLLVNAADALQEAGRAGQGRVVLAACTKDARLRISVEDDGPGVPPDLAQRIFDPFFTTKELGGGIGIGLTLSREFAHELGGQLLVETSELGGAKFVLDLPLAGARALAA